MATIRVGLVGLGAAEAGLGPGRWGAAAHLNSFKFSPKYELVAVCNSSVESARYSIEYHKLPSTVKAYGRVEDLANDPDVDLISVSIIVMKHLQAALPAIRAKKQVFVEWPLGASTKEAEEMEALARQHNLRTVVGLQFRADPFILKTKELIESGAIGQVMSTQAWLCPTILPLDTWLADAEFFLDYGSGGNEYHIGFAHFMDAFTYLMGDWADFKSTMSIQTPYLKTVNFATGEVKTPAYKRTAPDHVFVQGNLKSGAIASVNLRKAQKSVDGLGLRWLISGKDGEIELTIRGSQLQMGSCPRTIRMTQGVNGETKDIDWEDMNEPLYIKNVLSPGTNTARVYDAFADSTVRYADFKRALEIHQLLDKIATEANFPYHKP